MKWADFIDARALQLHCGEYDIEAKEKKKTPAMREMNANEGRPILGLRCSEGTNALLGANVAKRQMSQAAISSLAGFHPP